MKAFPRGGADARSPARSSGHLREGREDGHPHHRQEEVPRPGRLDRRSGASTTRPNPRLSLSWLISVAQQFVYVIRKRIKLSPEKAIFIFVDEVLPPTAALMSSIYEEHKDEDGFLYVT